MIWSFAVFLIFMLQVLLNLPNPGNRQPIQISTCLKYLALNVPWIIVLSLPISGLFSTSSVYISGLLNKTSRQFYFRGKSAISRLSAFLAPAATLGACIAFICLLLALFVVPATNTHISSLAGFMKTGAVPADLPKSDREMSVGDLLKQVNQLSLESGQASQEQKTGLRLKRNQFMVEVYKKFAIPLLGILLPVLGGIMALILSKLRSGQRIFLFLFDILILIFIWLFLVAGESWGDRGVLSPFASMFLTPAFAATIIVALIKRTGEILASTGESV